MFGLQRNIPANIRSFFPLRSLHILLLATTILLPTLFALLPSFGQNGPPHRKPKVALISCSSQTAAYNTRVLQRALLNRQRYCDRHGYKCILNLEDAADHCRADDFLHLVSPGAWAKIPLMRSCLLHFDIVSWIDVDALIIRENATLEDFLTSPACQGKDVAISGDDCGAPGAVNSGFIVAASSTASLDVLNDVLNRSRDIQTRMHGWWENKAFIDIINENSTSNQMICSLNSSVQWFPSNPTCMNRTDTAFLQHWAGSIKSSPGFVEEFLASTAAFDAPEHSRL